MKRIMMSLAGLALLGSSAFAADTSTTSTCPPVPCPPKMKWVTVCETVKVQVPTKVWVDEPVQVSVRKKVPVQREIEVDVKKWTCETVMVPCKEKVFEDSEVTVNEKRTENREEKRTRKVCKVVPQTTEKEVCRVIKEKVCEPCGGWKTVKRTVTEKVPVTTYTKVYEDEEYTVNCPVVTTVPVKKTVKVCKFVDVQKPVQKRVAVVTKEKRTVCDYEYVCETKTVNKKKCVKVMKEVEKVVKKKVQVPVEPTC